MRLSSKTLKRLVKGAVYFTEDRGYLTCHRYSKAQVEYMADEKYDWGWRMRAGFCGGVRLEFKTDAKTVSFDYRASHSHERSNTVDLYVDDRLTQVYKLENRLKGKITFNMPQGEKRVTIYLPCECNLEIKGFTLDGSYKSIKDKGERVLIIGDSITQGAGPDIASASYLNILTRKIPNTYLGQGIGGYRYEPQDLMRVEGFEPDKIIVFLGTNYYEYALENGKYDYGKAVEDFYARLIELYPSTPILVITPLWRTNAYEWEKFLWCINKIKSVCESYPSIRVADGFELMPNVAECLADGVHPNTYGSTLLAENLINFMRDIKFLKI
ncbi:MAG: SGNH/GDSL hydrolase family protein [Clostridia bacterium]|nr:SGNH/GDSL hydrolase family protein [Clostridia bacterium]